jgi:hypothetical protein
MARTDLRLLTAALFGGLLLCGSAGATIIGGEVTSGSGSFIKLSPGFTESTPDNTVGDDTFQDTNLYGFDEDQNVQVETDPLTVDYLVATSATGSLAVGTVVASHYIFFDPAGTSSQVGTVRFDSDILALITSTNNLAASDYLANTGVNYLNPGLRGLESNTDTAVVSGAREVTVRWTASTPGDYIRVLTTFSPGAEVPLPATALLALFGLGLMPALRRRRAKA